MCFSPTIEKALSQAGDTTQVPRYDEVMKLLQESVPESQVALGANLGEAPSSRPPGAIRSPPPKMTVGNSSDERSPSKSGEIGREAVVYGILVILPIF